MEQHISKLLATSPLFAQMAEPAIAQALDAVGWRAVTYRPHDVYALAGSACTYVDIVLTGEMVDIYDNGMPQSVMKFESAQQKKLIRAITEAEES